MVGQERDHIETIVRELAPRAIESVGAELQRNAEYSKLWNSGKEAERRAVNRYPSLRRQLTMLEKTGRKLTYRSAFKLYRRGFFDGRDFRQTVQAADLTRVDMLVIKLFPTASQAVEESLAQDQQYINLVQKCAQILYQIRTKYGLDAYLATYTDQGNRMQEISSQALYKQGLTDGLNCFD